LCPRAVEQTFVKLKIIYKWQQILSVVSSFYVATSGENNHCVHHGLVVKQIKVCPENILEKGRGGFSQVNFQRGECTFCAYCVDHCPNNALQRTNGPPWQIKAHIDTQCLIKQGITCVTCHEHCELEAIQFSLDRVAIPTVNLEICNGCGACYQGCPVTAIIIKERA